MGAMIASAPKANGSVFAHSDREFEQSLQEAIEASNEDYAFHTQLQEALHFSNLTYAYDMQLADIAVSSPVPNPSSSKDEPSSSHSKDENDEYTPVNYYEQDNGFEFEGYGGEKGGNSRGKEVDTGVESSKCGVQNPVPLQLCGICFENSGAEMFEGIRCLDRFCHPCLTKYIHTRLKQKRRQMFCPNESCGEPLNPQECRYFLPVEIIDAWSATTILEGQNPELEKVCCPFSDCSAVLEKEDIDGLSAIGILNAECPFCSRMICVRCMAAWHADLECKKFKP